MAQLGQAKLEPGLSFNYDLFEPNKLFLGLELGPQTLTLKLKLFFQFKFLSEGQLGGPARLLLEILIIIPTQPDGNCVWG